MSEQERSQDIAVLLWAIARPALIWTGHFIFVYVALSAACTSREITPYGLADTAIIIISIPAIVAAGWSVFKSGDSQLAIAARWTGIISVVAILFTAAPVILMDSCG